MTRSSRVLFRRRLLRSRSLKPGFSARDAKFRCSSRFGISYLLCQGTGRSFEVGGSGGSTSWRRTVPQHPGINGMGPVSSQAWIATASTTYPHGLRSRYLDCTFFLCKRILIVPSNARLRARQSRTNTGFQRIGSGARRKGASTEH